MSQEMNSTLYRSPSYNPNTAVIPVGFSRVTKIVDGLPVSSSTLLKHQSFKGLLFKVISWEDRFLFPFIGAVAADGDFIVHSAKEIHGSAKAKLLTMNQLTIGVKLVTEGTSLSNNEVAVEEMMTVIRASKNDKFFYRAGMIAPVVPFVNFNRFQCWLAKDLAVVSSSPHSKDWVHLVAVITDAEFLAIWHLPVFVTAFPTQYNASVASIAALCPADTRSYGYSTKVIVLQGKSDAAFLNEIIPRIANRLPSDNLASTPRSDFISHATTEYEASDWKGGNVTSRVSWTAIEGVVTINNDALPPGFSTLTGPMAAMYRRVEFDSVSNLTWVNSLGPTLGVTQCAAGEVNYYVANFPQLNKNFASFVSYVNDVCPKENVYSVDTLDHDLPSGVAMASVTIPLRYVFHLDDRGNLGIDTFCVEPIVSFGLNSKLGGKLTVADIADNEFAGDIHDYSFFNRWFPEASFVTSSFIDHDHNFSTDQLVFRVLDTSSDQSVLRQSNDVTAGLPTTWSLANETTVANNDFFSPQQLPLADPNFKPNKYGQPAMTHWAYAMNDIVVNAMQFALDQAKSLI